MENLQSPLTEREYSSGYEIFPVGNVTEKTVST